MAKRDGEMKALSSLFTRYKDKLKAPQKTVIDVTIEVIFDVTGLVVDPKRCTYTVSSKTLNLGVPSLLKQEIKMHHEEIMMHLKGRLGEYSVPKIIL